jgi:hypothetical protein
MNTLTKLEKKIHEACPELLELSFGCEVEIDTPERYSEFADKKREKAFAVSFIPSHQNGEDWDGPYMTLWLPDWNEYYEPKDPNLEDREDDEYIEILGHPIGLEHVLRAIDQKNGKGIYPPQIFAVGHPCAWDLTKPLSLQLPSVHKFLLDILE